ncbi:MAG TPA: type II secretion system protein [Bacillota bacterium]|nr:type II secretion system protein [Bacillota bacterium]HPT88150.1 type II secretion system protein [Bacillota bacterium]
MPKWVEIFESEHGFAMVKLIVAVIILAVLAGVALVHMGGSEENVKASIVKADLRMLATAIKVYKAKEGDFPESLSDLLKEGTKGYKPLLNELPMDPFARITEEDQTADYNYSKTLNEARISSDKNSEEFIKIVK